MLSPEYLWSIADSVVNEYDELNKWAVKDMAERIMAAELYDYERLPGTARYRAWMLNQAGMHYEDMSKKVAEITKKSKTDIMKMFIEAGLTAIENDFAPFGKEPYDISKDKKATQLLQSAYERTNGELHNYTRTTMDNNHKLMIDTLDKAYFDVSTGAKSYSEVIREAIDTVSKESCKVSYPDSGHMDSIETAVRRAVMTGVNQGTAKISLLNCEKLGTDYVIVSAHVGARYNDENKIANHLGWQGGVYKIHGTGTYSNEKKGIINAIKRFLSKIGFVLKSDYIPNLEEETGFPSNPLGLCGYNCRHSFYPFVPEVDDPKKYKHIVTDVEESKRKYDLSQKQRYKERDIRKLKSDLICYQTAIDNCKDEYTKFELQLEYDKTAALLQKRNKAYREFCQENDLQVESERIKVAKWKREQAYQATRGANEYKKVTSVENTLNRKWNIGEKEHNFEREQYAIVTKAKRVLDSNNELFISDEVKIHRNDAIMFYENIIGKIKGDFSFNVDNLEAPRYVVVGKNELNKDTVAAYNPKLNAVMLRGDLYTKEKMIQFQTKEGTDFYACSKNYKSSVMHEYCHWYIHQIKKRVAGSENSIIIYNKFEEFKAKIVDMILEKHYNVRDISKYAYEKNSVDEILAEAFTKMRYGKSNQLIDDIVKEWNKYAERRY